MIKFAAAFALLFASVQAHATPIKETLIRLEVPGAIEKLEEAYPEVDWSLAPTPHCASPEDQAIYNEIEEEGGFIFGTFAYEDFSISMNCKGYMSTFLIESTIFHELIHWMQMTITYGEEITAPIDQFQGIGIGMKTYERLGCAGAIEGEAWAAEFKAYPEEWGQLYTAKVKANVYLMLACHKEYADYGSPLQ